MKRIVLLSIICITLFSCDSEVFDTEPLSVSPTSLSLYAGDTYQLSVNKRNVTYIPTDSWYATVSTNGLVKAQRIGSTTIKVSNGDYTQYVNVEVKSKYQLYPDMDKYIGKSFDLLKDAFGSYDQIVPMDGEMEGYVGYLYKERGKYSISFIFIYEDDDPLGIIQAVAVSVPVAYEKQMETYIWDRYFCADVLNDVYYLYNHEKTVSLILEYQSNQFMYLILYGPYE